MATRTSQAAGGLRRGSDSGEIHVLHIDDDPDMLAITRGWFETTHDSIRVRSVESATAALALLTDGDVDCVVSDFDMAEMNGLEFLRAVRERDPSLPFILFTGKGTEEIASEAISAGVTDYLRKEGVDTFTVLANRIETCVAKDRAERENDRRLQAMETAREGIGLLDGESRFIYVNEAFTDVYGYRKEELIGEEWRCLYFPEDYQTVADDILPSIPETGYWSGETPQRRKDGSRILTSQALSYSETHTVICVVRDITADAEQERLLAEERQRFDLLIEAITEYGIVGMDVDGTITSWNSGSKRINGYSPDEILGRPISVLYTEEDQRAGLPEQHLQNALHEGPVHAEGWRVERGGLRFWVDFTLTAVTDENDAHRGYVCVMRDMTERVLRERQLQRQIEQLDQFASVLSHDLRNPLLVAKQGLALARMDPDHAEENFDHVDRAHERIDDLIESLLRLAREGKVVSEFEWVDLGKAAERAWDTVGVRDAQLVVETEERTIQADGERLRTLLENLFRNAVDHVGADVTVRVGTLDNGFYVEDDGPGIPAEQRDRVFEHGFTSSEAGSGFGLSIVASIAAAHGWDVTVTDGRHGGARFEFRY